MINHCKTLMPLTDKIAFVSGRTGALGSAIAEGCSVFVSYLHESELRQLPVNLQTELKTFKPDRTDEFHRADSMIASSAVPRSFRS